jgi:RNA polymerase sigma-70 factor (ECF subfamily)
LTSVDDEELVRRAQAGEPGGRAAFDELVTRHHEWLRRYLFHLLGDAGLADDVAQETFLRAYTHVRKLREPSRLRGWLRQIGTRTAFNLRRARSTRARYEEGSRPPRNLPGAEEVVSAEEAFALALDALPYGYREILVMRYVEGLELDEIGRTLGLGASACKMRLKRARDEFKLHHARMVDATDG